MELVAWLGCIDATTPRASKRLTSSGGHQLDVLDAVGQGQARLLSLCGLEGVQRGTHGGVTDGVHGATSRLDALTFATWVFGATAPRTW